MKLKRFWNNNGLVKRKKLIVIRVLKQQWLSISVKMNSYKDSETILA